MSDENPSQGRGYTAVIEQAFPGLPQDVLQRLRDFAVSAQYPADTVLCRENDPADKFYVITGGRLAVTRDMEGDEQFLLGFLGPGQYFGEMALLSEDTRAATVTTITDTEVLEISKVQFEEIFSSSRAVARSFLNTLVNIIRETDKRAIEDLEARNVELAKAYTELEAAQADRIARAALEAQMEVAGKAQRSLLPPTLPLVDGYAFAARFEPAVHIGGDFYDAHLLENGQVNIVLADVSDKGAHAALFMAVARTLFLTEGEHYDKPVEVVRAVHRGLLAASNYDMFVTALYGTLDPAAKAFRYVRAGHDEPLYMKADGSATFLGGRGRFLGLWPDAPPTFEEETLPLEAGDILVIYSDGVTDMRSPDGESFGRDRVRDVVKGLRDEPARAIADGIYDAVQTQRGTAAAFDDFTLLVMKVE